MTRTIQLAASLPAPPDRLFDMYLDATEHAAFTGAPVVISPTPGSEFQAFNGVLSGRMLQVVPKRLIVQSWRSPHWTDADLDSTLTLTFLPDGDGGRIDLVQVNVVDRDFAGVSQGWEKFYWTPWRAYLSQRTAEPGISAKLCEGQTWKYKSRSGEENSTVTILKVETYDDLGRIVHLRIDGLRVPNRLRGNFVTEVPHLVLKEHAVLASVAWRIKAGGPVPNFSKAYEAWRAAYANGKAFAPATTVAATLDWMFGPRPQPVVPPDAAQR